MVVRVGLLSCAMALVLLGACPGDELVIAEDGYPVANQWWELRSLPDMARAEGPQTTYYHPLGDWNSGTPQGYNLTFTDTDGVRQGYRDPVTGVPIPGDWQPVIDGVEDLGADSHVHSCEPWQLNPSPVYLDGTAGGWAFGGIAVQVPGEQIVEDAWTFDDAANPPASPPPVWKHRDDGHVDLVVYVRVVGRPGAIQGFVRTDRQEHQAIPQAQVTALNHPQGTIAGSATSGQLGEYTISPLLPGDYVIECRYPGYTPDPYRSGVLAVGPLATVTHDITLTPPPEPGRIHGMVRTPAQQPVSGATLTAYPQPEGQPFDPATSDLFGSYVIDPLPDGDYIVICTLEGWTPAASDIVTVGPGGGATEVNFVLTPPEEPPGGGGEGGGEPPPEGGGEPPP